MAFILQPERHLESTNILNSKKNEADLYTGFFGVNDYAYQLPGTTRQQS
jgi:hypothetical protein